MSLPSNWTITKRALGRALDMQLDPSQINDVLMFPESIALSRKLGGQYFNYRLGDLTAGVAHWEDGTKHVITFVWSNEDAWRRDVDAAPYMDREYREGFLSV